jgi:hypothetical protein
LNQQLKMPKSRYKWRGGLQNPQPSQPELEHVKVRNVKPSKNPQIEL